MNKLAFNPKEQGETRTGVASNAVSAGRRWADTAEIAAAGLLPARVDAAGIVVGALGGAALIDATMAPVMVMGPCRSGKSTSVLVPTLLTWRRSAVVVDVHGELSGITASWRQEVAGNRVRRVYFDGETPPPDTQALIRELRETSQPTTVYCTVNPSDLLRVETSLRAFLGAILQDSVAGAAREPADALLLVLDKFAMLGKLADLPQKLAALSDKGVKLLIAAQAFGALEAVYGADAPALWNGCAQVLFAPNEFRTADLMAAAISEGHRKTYRLTADEVLRLPGKTSVIAGLTTRPIRAMVRGYFEDAHFGDRAAKSA